MRFVTSAVPPALCAPTRLPLAIALARYFGRTVEEVFDANGGERE
jgi:DNA-binding XRE family transcriptional regulator